jgi:hypothetical protein
MGLSRCALVRALVRGVFAYSTMVAIYLMGNSIAHPGSMTMPFTHVVDRPTEGVALAFALLSSVVSYFLLRVSAHLSESSGRGDS